MNKYGFQHQDLDEIVLMAKKLKLKDKIKKEKRNPLSDNVITEKKKNIDIKSHKLDNETENMKIETINKSISQEIRNNRTRLKLKHKDLANKINVPVQTIQQYENGTTQTDIKILIKLEKVLKCKLTGKGFTK